MQGFNMGRYVPPELEGTISANKLAGKHALGSRANKLKDGILTVRFEMPFAIWCTHCPPETLIGQGVRFNAEKKRVGHYHSTPIYSFRMRHPACGGWIEIRTDPQNTEYVVTEGAQKRDYGEWKEDRDELGNPTILTEEERERRRNDAFAMLEGKVQDKVQARTDADRIKELKAYRNKSWEDPYTQNQKLRALFRPGRKLRQQKAAETEQLRDRLGLGMDLLDETEDDAKRAKFVEFGGLNVGEDADVEAAKKPLFKGTGSKPTNKSGAAKSRNGTPDAPTLLAATIRGNTRAAMDPFLTDRTVASKGHTIAGLKRKRPSSEDEPPARKADDTGHENDTNRNSDTNDMNNETTKPISDEQTIALVTYNSDDD
ncbi:MAG: hypothetical protein M1822_008750 [Bathelium mastoideum]|nr:MAG: hypothetical protein M1822_008750 [Bathelium mastoideum]